jgi:hypothetical protein
MMNSKTSHGNDQKKIIKKLTDLENRNWRSKTLLGIVIYIIVFILIVSISGLAGYQSGQYTKESVATQVLLLSLDEQYTLAEEDIKAEQYEIAFQRLEYILSKNPTYPNATEQLTFVMQILYATATPVPPTPTATSTPTRDLRPIEDLYHQSLQFIKDQAWIDAIDILITLRTEDKTYLTTRVDGLFYLSLRYLGVEKIWQDGDLEGGLYDLSLAERFGPLDVQASSAREFARLYMIGLSFWEVYPEQAVYYFKQVSDAAPGLRDSSGWTALERYRSVLIQHGDYFVSKKAWCDAQVQYERAMTIRSEGNLAEILQAVMLKCSPPTSTAKPENPSPQPTVTLLEPTAAPILTSTSTNTIVVPPTPTQIPPTSPVIPDTPTETETTQPTAPTETQTTTPPENTEETP